MCCVHWWMIDGQIIKCYNMLYHTFSKLPPLLPFVVLHDCDIECNDWVVSTPALYLKSTVLKSQPRDWLLWLRIYMVFVNPSRKMTWHDMTVPYIRPQLLSNSLFTLYTIWCYTVQVTKSAVKWITYKINKSCPWVCLPLAINQMIDLLAWKSSHWTTLP